MYGEIIEELRKDAGFTQEELGKMLHVSNSTVAGYECERISPPIAILSSLSDIFHVNADYILGRTKIRQPWSEYLQKIHYAEKDIEVYTIIDCIRSMSDDNREIVIRLIATLANRDNNKD